MPGGGGGGGYSGGGGGAGGVIHKTNIPVTPGATYTIVVGRGGAGGPPVPQNGNGFNGDNSSFSGPGYSTALMAYGGGRGLSEQDIVSSTGGSGGGKTVRAVWTAGVLSGVSAGTSTVRDSQQGFAGGEGYMAVVCPGGFCGGAASGGGGGGAGGAGSDAYDTHDEYCPSHGGTGGPGASYTISGAEVTYAAGGGGGGCEGGAAGTGGSGTGNAGTGNASSGRPDRGDGGGGHYYGQAGAGGSGIVVIRY
jgi:hypothetical protein